MRNIFLVLSLSLLMACNNESYSQQGRIKNIPGDEIKMLVKQKKFTAIYFWTTWCAPCRSTLKETIRPLLDTNNRDDFQVLVVALSKDVDKVSEIIKQAGIQDTTYVVSDFTFGGALFEKNKMNDIIRSMTDKVEKQNKVPVVLVMDEHYNIYGTDYSILDLYQFLKGEL